MRRITGYLLGAALASLFFIVAEYLFMRNFVDDSSTWSLLGAASSLWLIGGCGRALLLMSGPWVLAVRMHRRLPYPGAFYFAILGAVGLFIIGCIIPSLSLYLSFIENLKVVGNAGDLQGTIFLVAGCILGLAYWFIGERSTDHSDQSTPLIALSAKKVRKSSKKGSHF
jgi:hypothetical protein